MHMGCAGKAKAFPYRHRRMRWPRKRHGAPRPT